MSRPIHLAASFDPGPVRCTAKMLYTANRTALTERVTCKRCLRAMALEVELKLRQEAKPMHWLTNAGEPRPYACPTLRLKGDAWSTGIKHVTCEACLVSANAGYRSPIP